MGKLLAICISPKKGTEKKEVKEAVLLPQFGIEGDAHAGKWHRQVSLLSLEKIEDFRKKGAEVAFGAFGENLVVEGFDLSKCPVGSEIHVGEAVLELTQLGKECHSHCAIFHRMGDCIMPREGVFSRVIKGGTIREGDSVEVFPPDPRRAYTAAVITLSDRASAGEYEDQSGPLIQEFLTGQGMQVEEYLLLPDGREALEKALIRLADQREISLIITTGGTGFSERDCTPEATKAVCDREVPGIPEALRQYSLTITKKAMLSRQTAGIRKYSLIINLPGSPKACKENLEFLFPELFHGIGILRGTEKEN